MLQADSKGHVTGLALAAVARSSDLLLRLARDAGSDLQSRDAIDEATDNVVRACLLGGIVLSEMPDAQSATVSSSQLESHSALHGKDAASDRRHASSLAVGATLLLLANVSGALYFVRSSAAAERSSLAWFYLSLAGIVAAVSLGLLWLADRYRRSADESRRLARQFAGLEPFLEPMPVEMRSVLRATLIPRLFPRILDDADVLRDPLMLDADTMLQLAGMQSVASNGATDQPDDPDGDGVAASGSGGTSG